MLCEYNIRDKPIGYSWRVQISYVACVCVYSYDFRRVYYVLLKVGTYIYTIYVYSLYISLYIMYTHTHTHTHGV